MQDQGGKLTMEALPSCLLEDVLFVAAVGDVGTVLANLTKRVDPKTLDLAVGFSVKGFKGRVLDNALGPGVCQVAGVPGLLLSGERLLVQSRNH